jgi:Uma2 family endonuclease
MITAARTTTKILSLESGDRLSRAEFERRYTAMPQLKKAELIEGVVYVASPVRVQKHGKPHSDIITWLGTYEAATPGIMVCDNTTVRLDPDNEPQPDALLRIEEACGGQSRISDDDYIEGAPELIVEIAASSASYDLHDKKEAYRRNGVQEYIVWQVADQKVSWFSLQGGEYATLESDEAGIIHSRIFPGLNLQVKALLTDNLAEVLAEVRQGTATASHESFVEKLKQRKNGDYRA